MKNGKSEMMWMAAGLGLAGIGGGWFGLSLAGALDGLAMMFGYFLGAGLVLAGLIMAGVYFFRWRRIQKLLRGEDVLADWGSAQSQAIISPTSAYVDGRLYLWGTAGTRLEDVQIEGPSLQITLGEATTERSPITGARLWRTRRLSIPIPTGQDLAAQSVLAQLRSRLPGSD
jgi:hypothetical protein